MLDTIPSKDEIELAGSICDNARKSGVGASVSNCDKWRAVRETFGIENLLTEVDVEKVISTGDVTKRIVAMYLIDLRLQFIEAQMGKTPGNMAYHVLFMENSKTLARLKQLVLMAGMTYEKPDTLM